MSKSPRWFNSIFVLALLLGFAPAARSAPRARAAASSHVMAQSAASSSMLAPGALRGPQAPTATFAVDSALDANDANPGDGACADSADNCTLRAAISEANALGGAHTINLQAGAIYTLTLAGAGEDANATGDLDILTGTLTIAGNGATLNAGQLDRALHVFTDTVVTLSDLTVINGRAPNGADSATLGEPGGDGAPGGGIYNAGSLTVHDGIIQDNNAGAGGNGGDNANGGAGGSGGGIYSAGPLTVTGSTLQNNRAGAGGNGGDGSSAGGGGAGGAGGGIGVTGQITLSDSTLHNNQAGNGGTGGRMNSEADRNVGGAGGAGGGISADVVTGSHLIITNNRAGNGGLGGDSPQYHSGISDLAGGNGGNGGSGGGIKTNWLTLSHTTLQNNQAGAGGNGGSPTVDNIYDYDNGTHGGSGGAGGDGGGFFAYNATLTVVMLSDNAAGAGGNGQNGMDGKNSSFGDGGDGGNGGGSGTGGRGGGGYIGEAGVLVQCVVQNNAAGANGNNGNGGQGGHSYEDTWEASGGDGGDSYSTGYNPLGGHGGGLYAITLQLVHTDILSNTAGSSLKTARTAGDGGDASMEYGRGGAGGNGTSGYSGGGGGVYATHGLTIDGGVIRFNRAGNGGPGDNAGCGGLGLLGNGLDGSPGGGGNGGDGGGVRYLGNFSDYRLYGVTISDNQVGAGGSPGGLPCSGPGMPNGQPGQGANSLPAQTINPPRALLAMTKTAVDLNGAPLQAGDQIRYTIVVTNVISAPMTGLRITDTLPSGVTLVAATPGGYSGPDPLVWNVGDLGANASWTAQITMTVNSDVPSIGGNYAQAQSDQDGPHQAGPIYPPGGGDVQLPLGIVKVAIDLDGATLQAGDQIRYTVIVTNTTDTAMTGLRITDTLPSGVTFAAAAPGGYSGPNPLVWNVGNLGAHASWTAQITVTVDSGVASIGGNYAQVVSDQTFMAEDGPVCPNGNCMVYPTCSPVPWHVFLGGSGEDVLYDMITDDFCNVYVTGFSDNTWGSPVRAHAPITTNTGSYWMDENVDVFVAKLDADHNIVWNTFLGGVGYDEAYSLALDAAGHLYVSGRTQGDERAEWGDPLVSYINGNYRRRFVAQLDAATGALNWNTFIGPRADDYGDVQVDDAGNLYVYVNGVMYADYAYPVTNCYFGECDRWDWVEGQQIVKLDADGNTLWSTYFEIPTNWVEHAGSCVLDNADHLICAGHAHTTWGTPLRPYAGDGEQDVSVFQLNTSDGTLVWNTFLGGLDDDWMGGLTRYPDASPNIGVDADDNVYLVGSSEQSWGNPVDPYLWQYDAWVAKLDVNGVLQWNTFQGRGDGAVVDSGGDLYIVGGRGVDAGATQLDPDTAAVLDSSHLGGDSGQDWSSAIAVDGNDTPLIGGYSFCEWGAPLLPHSGDYDAWVASWGAAYGGAECVAHGDFKKTAEDVNGAPLYAGDLVRYTIAFTNTGALTMTNAVITDVLPAGLAFVAATGSPVSADPLVWNLGTVTTGTTWSAVITAAVDGSSSSINQNVAQLTCDEHCNQSAYASLPSANVEGFALTMSITGAGSGVVSPTVGIHGYPAGAVVTLIATPNSGSTFDGWSGDADCADGSVTMTVNKTCTATFTLSATPPALALHKTAAEQSAAPLLVGDRILYTIRVTNTTTGTLTNLVVTDTLPAGVTFFDVPKGASRPFTRNGNQVVWERASLAAGASLTLQVIGKATGDPTPVADNCASATSAQTPAPVSACANLGDPNVQEALTLLKNAVDINGAPLLVNDVIRYTIYVTNAHASVTMTGGVVTDTLPAGTVFVTATQPYTLADGMLWWQIGDLAPGESWTVAVDQRVDGSVNPIAGNVAAVWCDQQDWQETGDVYPPDPVIPTALKVSKRAEEYQNTAPLLLNARILYTIRVTNTNAVTVTGLVVTDTLPAGVTFFDVPKGPSRPFTRNGQQIVWTRASLAAGGALTFQVIGKVDGSANPIGVNRVVATCAEDAASTSAAAQVPGDGVHEPGLVVTGTANGGGTPPNRLQAQANLAPGDLITYAIALTNANPTHAMSAVSVTAALPSGVEFVSATPAGYTGALTLTWEIGSLAPGAVWEGEIVVRITGLVGDMVIAAASTEQSPVEAVIAAPPGATRTLYLPLITQTSAP